MVFFLLHAAKVRSSCEEGPGQSALQSAIRNWIETDPDGYQKESEEASANWKTIAQNWSKCTSPVPVNRTSSCRLLDIMSVSMEKGSDLVRLVKIVAKQRRAKTRVSGYGHNVFF